MEKKHTANEKMDAVLTVLNNANVELINAVNFAKLGIKDSLNSNTIMFNLVAIGIKDIDYTELHLILPYLIKHEYISVSETFDQENFTYTNTGIKTKIYKITLIGKMFIENGGLVGVLNRENEVKNKTERVQIQQRRLTWILAFSGLIASIYYLHELYVYYYGYINPKGLP